MSKVTKKEFVSQYIKKQSESIAKKFPDDFITPTSVKRLEIPQKTLVLGDEFFGQYEILTTEGIPVLQAENIYTAKYVIYTSKDRRSSITIPKNDNEIRIAVESYERYLDSILMDIKESFKKNFQDSPDINSV
jgi:hypothetical protein